MVVNYVFMGYKGCLAGGCYSAIVTNYPTIMAEIDNIILFV